MNTLLIILAIALIIWIVGTYLAIQGIEWPVYKREVARDTYEIREYESYIVAEVVVEWDMKTALYGGFRQLAGYIFGGNTSQASVKMTVPVMDTTESSESIAMTTPVMESGTKNGKHTIAFTMPSSYTLATLPKPNNANIRFRKVAKSRKAVLRYTWYATEGRVEAKKKILKDLLNRDGYIMKWEMISAQYNPPMSFPFLRRNEIMVDIE